MTLRSQSKLASLIVAGVALLLFSSHLDAPFTWNHEGWNGSFYGIAARNFLRYGYVDLGFMHCVEAGSIVDYPTMYLRHPPLNSLLASVFLWLFGDSELSLRLGPYLISVASTVLLFLWMNRYFATRPWLAASVAICAAATPVWAFYGSMLEPLGAGVMFSILGSLYFLDRWLASRSAWDQFMVLAFLLFGFLWDWAAFYTAGYIGLILWWSQGRPGWRSAALYLGFALVSGILLLLWILHLDEIANLGSGQLSHAASTRVGWFHTMQDDGGNVLRSGDLVMRIMEFHAARFFLPLSVMGLISAVWLAWTSLRSRSDPRLALLLVPLFVAILHILLFPQGAYVHDYWQTYLAIGLPIPIFVYLERHLRGPGRMRFDLVFLAIALTLAVTTRVQIHDWWRATDPAKIDFPEQGRELATRTAPEELMITNRAAVMPPMLQYYADRKAGSGAMVAVVAAKPLILANLLMAAAVLEQPIAGFLVSKADAETFLPTLDALVRDHGWAGPFDVGPNRFWDAKP